MANPAPQQVYDINQVRAWLTAMGERGIYQSTSARLRATAIDQITSILAMDERNDPQWVLDNLDDLTARWATKNNAKGDTAQTYKSRAKVALEDFFRYQQDPLSFKPRVKVVSPEPAKRSERKPAKEASTAEAFSDTPTAAASVPTRPASPARGFRSYPLDTQGAEFIFQLPAAGLTLRDVQRVAWHLATMATDFDPTQQTVRNPLARKDD
jgi:hypothetical protein